MPPSKLKIKKIKRALKIPPSSSWEFEMSCNFTPERDALIAIDASEMERYDLEFTEGVDSLNSDSDSEFPIHQTRMHPMLHPVTKMTAYVETQLVLIRIVMHRSRIDVQV